MKKKTLLLILTAIEFLTLIFGICAFALAFDKTFELTLKSLQAPWLGAKDFTISSRDSFLILLSNILPLLFLIVLIIRFIFTNKNNRIAIILTPLIGAISICFFGIDNSIINILGIAFFVMMIIIYFYSYKIDFKDNSLLFKE